MKKNKIRHSANIYTFEALVLVKVPLVEPRPVPEAPHGGPRPYEAGERLREPVVGLVLLAVGPADALAPRPRLGDALKCKNNIHFVDEVVVEQLLDLSNNVVT